MFPEWLVIGAVIWFLVSARRRARWARRERWRRRWGGYAEQRAEVAEAPRPRALPPESPLERAQREYVNGRITVEEYERELDRIYAGRGAASQP